MFPSVLTFYLSFDLVAIFIEALEIFFVAPEAFDQRRRVQIFKALSNRNQGRYMIDNSQITRKNPATSSAPNPGGNSWMERVFMGNSILCQDLSS